MNINSLYPVVHDLTEEETSHGYCTSYYMDLATAGCFSLQDLVSPAFCKMPARQDSEKISAGAFRRQSSMHPTNNNYTRSLVDDRNDTSSIEDRKTQFSDVYVLTRQVHKGNISNVWECVHRSTGVRYAAKVIDRRGLTVRNDQLVYLEVAKLNEIRGAPSGLPKLIDFYDEPKYFYIVTDYADGGDLLMTLLRRGKLSEDDAKACAKSLLQGIKYLHSNNICHRNLKPENILLKRARDLSAVIIADFGMATRVVIDSNGKRVRLNERCGTASYMAPEVIQQTPYDTQADMWSVGVILFYALAGALPFEDTSRRALYQKIVKGEYKFNTKDWLGVSKEAKRFISSLLQVDPDVRFTADEALEHSWLENVAVSNFADSPSLSKRKGPKLKGRVWKAMPWKRSSSSSATSEVLVDDSRSTSTVSLVSSDMTNEGRHNRGYSK